MQNTFFDTRLCNREFGSHLLSVSDLFAWAKSNRLHIPSTELIDASEFVQVEYLLSAIGSLSGNLSEAQAIQVIQNYPSLINNPAASIAPSWLLGGEAILQWRKVLGKAIDSDELTLLHFGSKLPVNVVRKAESSFDEIDFTLLASRSELITAFGKFTDMNQEWFHNLNDTPNLRTARKILGTSGRKNSEPLFCPYEVMQWLINPKRKKGRQLSEATGWRVFKNHFRLAYNAKAIGDPNDD
jgi:hypothetical protein